MYICRGIYLFITCTYVGYICMFIYIFADEYAHYLFIIVISLNAEIVHSSRDHSCS